jgi:hypothetical protein
MEAIMAHSYDSDVENAAYLIAKAIDRLGNADAATPMGGLEALGEQIGKIADALSSRDLLVDFDGLRPAVEEVASALREVSLSIDKIGPQE